MNTTPQPPPPEPTPEPTPEIRAVSIATKFEDKNVIITADDPPSLRRFLAQYRIEDTSEIRQTLTYLGPVVILASIKEIQESSKGVRMAGEFAARIGERSIDSGTEILTTDERAEAREAGLVIVYDDFHNLTGIEFRGAINNHSVASFVQFTRNGQFITDMGINAIESLLADGTLKERPVIHQIATRFDGVVSCYETEIPHASFDIMEEGIVICRAIVFSILDL